MISLLINSNGIVWYKKIHAVFFIFYAHSEKNDLRVLYIALSIRKKLTGILKECCCLFYLGL